MVSMVLYTVLSWIIPQLDTNAFVEHSLMLMYDRTIDKDYGV